MRVYQFRQFRINHDLLIYGMCVTLSSVSRKILFWLVGGEHREELKHLTHHSPQPY